MTVCSGTGGNVALGYMVDDQKQFQLDPETAPTVLKIFEMYASGKTMAEIIRYLNDRQIKTSFSNAFNKNSISRILTNRRYIGYYTYKGNETADIMPRIVSDELFYKVANMIERNKKAPARAKADINYILTTKIFCGHCNSTITGISGSGKSGKKYYYYKCSGAKIGTCKKKNVPKTYIEDLVVSETRKLLTKDCIDRIAYEVASLCEKENNDNTALQHLYRSIKENEKASANLLAALKQGKAANVLLDEIEKLNQERTELEKQLVLEETRRPHITQEQVKFFMERFVRGDIDDVKYRKHLIEVFINRIYLYDNKMTISYNVQDSHSECVYNPKLSYSVCVDTMRFFRETFHSQIFPILTVS